MPMRLKICFSVVAACIFALSGDAGAQQRRKAGEPQEQRGPRLDVEAIFDRQRDLIDAAVGRLAPSRPGTPELYFVGFASFSGQDVFRREVTAVREIVDERLATKGRSLLLINHRDTTTDFPLASATNLARVLMRLGKIMDSEKDTLVLFVTTHGLPSRLAVEFPRFTLNDITPDTLRGALDRSGIRNRILIISACYSGSFIERLQTPETLILPAARADRPSFGCSNDRSWTYFGDAFFNRALRETRSLPEAFQRARQTVTGWERERKFDPSEPQIFVGTKMAPHLDALAARGSSTEFTAR
jgi:hypothetical protein